MSNRQNKKQDRKMKQVAKTMEHNLKMAALDILHGIKETWEDKELAELAAWLLDKEAGPWG